MGTLMLLEQSLEELSAEIDALAVDIMRKIRLLGEAEAIIANRRRKLMETDFTKRVSEKG